jgi:hypothetical protein
MLGGLSPRLFFESRELSQTGCKISSLLERGEPTSVVYNALGVVLVHELAWFQRLEVSAERPVRGGLAGWRARRVSNYKEAFLARLSDKLAASPGMARDDVFVRLSMTAGLEDWSLGSGIAASKS